MINMNQNKSYYRLKKAWWVGLLCLVGIWGNQSLDAQVHLYADSVQGANGTQVIVPISANDFTGLIGMQGSIGWDTSVVTLDTIFQLGLPNLFSSNFGLTQAAAGRISFSWDDPTFVGVTVSDSSQLFALRFDVVGDPGDKSPVSFINTPTPLEFTDNTFSTTSFTTQGGEVEVGLGGNCGILGITAGAQVPCNPATNTYAQSLTLTYGNAPATGNLVVNGQTFPISGSPQTISLTNLLADGSGVDVTAFFSDDSTCARLETNVFTAPSPCASLLIFADSVTGTTGGTVNVPVRVRNFVNLIGAQGTVGWNTSVVTFDTVSNFGLPGMFISNFGLTQVASGRLPFSWDDPTFVGVNLPDSAILFEIEFNVVGGPGTQTPIEFFTTPTNLEFIDNTFSTVSYTTQNGEVDIPLGSTCAIQGITSGSQNPCNPLTNRYEQEVTLTYANAPATGTLVVNGQNFPIGTSPQTILLTNLLSDGQPVDVTAFFSADSACAQLETALFTAPASCGSFVIYADSVQGTQGGTVSVPVRANNFVSLIGAQGSLTWNTGVVIFDTVSNFGLPNLSVANFGLNQSASGLLTFSWDDPTFVGVTVADSAILFTLEFDVVGNPGTQTPVAFQSSPTNLEFVDNTFATIASTAINGEVEVPIGSNCALLSVAAGSQGACDSVTNRYTQDVTVTYANAPATGNLVINGQSFPIAASPQTVTLNNLYSDGTAVDVTAFFSADSACSISQTGLFTAPAPCGIFQLFADSLQGSTGTQVVVPVRVRNFVDLIGLQGTVEWDISVASFDTILNLGLPNLGLSNFGLGQTGSGRLTFSWDDPTFNGVTVADSTVIFAIRYDVVGGPGSVTPVAFVSQPTPLEVTDKGFQTLGFDTVPGQIEVPIVNCAVTDLAAGTQSACNQINNTYSQEVIVTYTTAPATGFLVVNGQAFSIGTSPQTVNLTGLSSNGLPVDVTAFFSDDTTCFRIENGLFSAPFSCISPNPTLFADSVDAISGTQVIVPVRVRNFADLIGMQGTIAWDTSVAVYDTIIQYGLPNMAISNFGTPLAPNGILPFSWDDPTLVGVSVPDSSVVFAIRYDVIGAPGTQTSVQFIDSPTFVEFTSNTFQTLPYDTIPGEIEVLLTSIATDTFGNAVYCIGDTIAVPFTSTGVFNAGNVFTVELSDANGSFALPTVIGSLAATSASSVTAVIPSVPAGSGYRIRIVASNPVTIGSDNGLDLTISNIQVNATAAICDGDSILLGGAFQTAAGVFVDTLVASNGCDSVVTTTLTIDPVFATNDTLSICQGDSALLGGAFQTVSGNYIDTLASNLGCDSVVTTFLNVTPSILSFDTVTICGDDSVFLAGAFQNIAGNYVDSLIASGGCDSLLTTTLVVLPLSFDTVQVAICDGDSAFAGGAFQTTGGTFVDTLVANNGCDSILTTELTILPVFAVLDTAEICEGDSIVLGGAFQTLAGNYVDTLLTQGGCDSVVTTTLNVIPRRFGNDSTRICVGDSIFLVGAFQTVAGNYTDTLLSSLGCDSVLTTTLFVDPVFATNDSVEICQGDSVFLGGAFQLVSGIFVDTLLSNRGCDSVVTTQLTVVPTLFGNDSVTICDGDSAFLAGQFQTVGGNYIDTLISGIGCDSIVTTLLTVLPNADSTQNISICDGDSVFAGGAFQTLGGIYTDTLVANNGCDSVLTTVLTILPTFAVLDTAEICEGDSIVLGGAFQSLAGNYVDTLVTQAGCDSVVTTTLNVIPRLFENDTARICAGDSFFVGGAFQSVAGNYTDTLISSLGCDSVLTTTLFVDPVFATNDSVEICQGDSIFLGGAFQLASGIFVDTLLSNRGCDSVVTTQLTVVPTLLGSASVTICDGDSAFLAGQFQTVSGSYVDTLVSAFGCDSVLTTVLTVLPNADSTQNVSICDGDSLFAGGAFQTVGGTYVDTLVATNGCDSVLTTVLTILPTFALNDTASICQGDSFLLPGGTFVSASGTYIDTLVTQGGCDSVITTQLTVFPTFNQSQTIDLCDGDSVVLPGGSVVSIAGIFVDTLLTNQGCDSIITTTVDILPTFFQTQSAEICDGDTFLLPGGDTALVAGTFTDTLLTQAGCDSIIVTTLTVNPTFAITIQDSICDGDSYLLPGGMTVSVAGTYVDSFLTVNGCDSIITTELFVNPVFNQSVNAQICQGDSLVLPGGAVVGVAGTYMDTLTTGAGCDSIIVTTVVVDSVFLNNAAASICQGDSFLLPGGSFVGVTGIYSDTLTSQAGCDSIVVTDLTVLPTFFTPVNDTFCAGDIYVLPSGATVTAGGTYLDTLLTVDGCDSIFSIDLIENPSYNLSQTIDICQGDTIVLPGGALVDSAGTFVDSLLTNAGCDSIITTTVVVQPVYNLAVNADICQGDSFTLPGGAVVGTAGVYTDSLLTGSGCDSVIVTTLVVNPTFAVNVLDTICDGDSYVLPGGAVVGIAGTYVDTLLTVNGCDSIITTDLTVNPSFSTPVAAAICQGDSFILPGGTTVTTAGVYSDTFSTALGCDSIIVTTLTVNPTYNQSMGVSICSGEEYILPGGDTVTTAGSYTDTLVTNAGCDSIIETMLTVNPVFFFSQSATICSNETFTLPGGTVVNTAGLYVDTLLTMVGCDSIIETEVFVNPASQQTLVDSICDGDSYILPGGTIVTTTGIYVDSFLTSLGCDSIIETDLTVITLDTGVTLTINTLTSEQSNATYQWLDCGSGIVPIGGATGQSYTPTLDGSYAVMVSQGGCTDTSACVTVIVIGVEESDFSQQLSVYPNPGAGWFRLDLGEELWEVNVEVWDAQGKRVWKKREEGIREMELDLNDVSSGMYFVRVAAGNRVGMVKLLVRR